MAQTRAPEDRDLHGPALNRAATEEESERNGLQGKARERQEREIR